MENSPAPNVTVTLSSSAAARIIQLREQKFQPKARLRIMVTGGGCSGFQYDMKLDEVMQEDDCLFETNGAELVIDKLSLDYMGDAIVDYVEKLGSAAFEIKNPNATAQCGCGSSFSV